MIAIALIAVYAVGAYGQFGSHRDLRNAIGGKITFHTYDSLSIRDARGMDTLVHVASTTEIVRGRVHQNAMDLEDGTFILVEGTRQDDGSVAATLVRVFEPLRKAQ